MGVVDAALAALLVWALIEGLWRGLISQLIDLAAFVVALGLATLSGPAVAAQLDRWVALPSEYQPLIGFGLVLTVGGGVLRTFFRLIGQLIPSPLTAAPPNRLLGIVPAVAKLLLLATVTLTAVAAVPSWPAAQQALDHSRVAASLIALGQSLRPLTDRVLGPLVPLELPTP